MSSFRERLLVSLALCAGAVQAQPASFAGIGRAATVAEIAAWDIDVRPDFQGLPTGSGTVAAGMVVWEGTCASCHGVFGESNAVSGALTGGTTADDVRSGRVARLTDSSFPGRSTFMKLATLSTLWDYIHRAMPWTAPRSLSADQVYAVTAYLLHLGGVVPENFTLSDRTMAQAQSLLPNRSGMTTGHAMWPGTGLRGRKPDISATACMTDCPVDVGIGSSLPEFARHAHGNLAEQNRNVGPQRGVDTGRPASGAPATAALASPAMPGATGAARPMPSAARSGNASGAAALALTRKHACVGCHGVDNAIVGPGFREIARRYVSRADAADYLTGRIRAGGAGVWGSIPMPPQALDAADARTISEWLVQGAEK